MCNMRTQLALVQVMQVSTLKLKASSGHAADYDERDEETTIIHANACWMRERTL